jgi:RND family efflux transporter MFP subunit
LQFPVEIAPVEARDVDYRVNAVGSVEAFEIVTVAARVSGVVEAVRFAEGDRVEPQRVLVEIEPQRFALAVDAARAALEKATAAHADAQAGLERRETATSRTTGIIPAEEIETWRTKVRTAAADVSQARVAMQQAELDQHDAFVRAPVAGIIQTRSVQTGQFVQPGTSLATLLRRDPLLLRFSVPEQDAGRLETGMVVRFRVRETSREYGAKITHVAAAADAASRMVAVTAHVDPGPDLPRPGAFAEVSISVGGKSQAPVIPETAVRPSERGFLAYVISNGKAHERILSLGMRTDDGRVEVREGLAAAESLVVRGAEALRDGASVRIVTGTPAAPGIPAAGGASGGAAAGRP